MARLKDKINDLKTKYGISDEAAREVLSLHDGDMSEANSLLTEEQNKVVSWNKFWFEKAPQIDSLASEYEKLKGQMDSLQSTINGQPQPPSAPNPAPVQATDADLEQRIYRNFSAVQKDIYNIQRYHLEHYKTLPDIAPIEQLIETKKMTPWAAYQEWVKPMETERTDKELREKITAELTAKFQNEATRSGVNGYMLSNKSALTGEEVTSPLDEVIKDRAGSMQPTQQSGAQAAVAAQHDNKSVEASGPNDFELMSDFVGSMRNGRAGQSH